MFERFMTYKQTEGLAKPQFKANMNISMFLAQFNYPNFVILV
jgi:hypothetical protein